MGSQGFTEHDWKLFSSRIAGWQERYMDKLNNEYAELLRGEGAIAGEDLEGFSDGLVETLTAMITPAPSSLR